MDFLKPHTKLCTLCLFTLVWSIAWGTLLTTKVHAQQAGQQFTMRVLNNRVIRISQTRSGADRTQKSQLNNLSTTATVILVEQITTQRKLKPFQNPLPTNLEVVSYQVLGAKSTITEWETVRSEVMHVPRSQTHQIITTIVPLL